MAVDQLVALSYCIMTQQLLEVFSWLKRKMTEYRRWYKEEHGREYKHQTKERADLLSFLDKLERHLKRWKPNAFASMNEARATLEQSYQYTTKLHLDFVKIDLIHFAI